MEVLPTLQVGAGCCWGRGLWVLVGARVAAAGGGGGSRPARQLGPTHPCCCWAAWPAAGGRPGLRVCSWRLRGGRHPRAHSAVSGRPSHPGGTEHCAHPGRPAPAALAAGCGRLRGWVGSALWTPCACISLQQQDAIAAGHGLASCHSVILWRCNAGGRLPSLACIGLQHQQHGITTRHRLTSWALCNAGGKPASLACVSLHEQDGLLVCHGLVVTGWLASAVKALLERLQLLAVRSWWAAALWVAVERSALWLSALVALCS